MKVITLEDFNDMPEGTCLQDAELKIINGVEYYEGVYSFRGMSCTTSIPAYLCEVDEGLTGLDRILARAAKAKGLTLEEAKSVLETARKNRASRKYMI